MRRLWLFCIVLLDAPAVATVFRSGNMVTISEGEVIDDDLVVSGGEVNMRGRVTGDLVAAGGTVRVTGPVQGSLIAAGGSVIVSGPVGGSAYLASGDLELNAPVERNVTAAGGTVVLGRATRVGRDVTVSGGDVTVSGTLGRDLRANAGKLTLAEGAVIGGSVLAQAGSHQIAPGARIQGEQQITRPKQQRGFTPLAWVILQLFLGVMLLLAGLVFIALGPRLTEETETALRERPWVGLAAGLVILLIGVPLCVLLLFTIVGIPLALVWAAIYFTAIYISPIFVAILVGRLVWRRPGGSLYTALLIGLGLLVLVRMIPFLGALVTFAALLFGLGALAVALYERAQRRRGAPTRQEAPPAAPPEPA